MKTSQLIDALTADRRPRGLGLQPRFWLGLGVGVFLSLCLFEAIAGPRSNFVASLQTLRFDLKFIDTLALTLPAAWLCARLLRPDARLGGFWLLFLAPALLLAVGVVGELALVPSDLWGTRLVGSNALHCLTIVPLLSIAPLAALLFVMREGAPSNPRLAGAAAGLASAGIAATFYAANCPDDSPLFVASWYPLATAIVVAIGSLAGDRFLRW